MRPKKRVLVRTEFPELRFVLSCLPRLAVVTPDHPEEDLKPGRAFDLVILDARGVKADLAAQMALLLKIAGPSVPVLLIAHAPIVGVEVTRVVYRNEHEEGLMFAVLDAVRMLTPSRRGPAPKIVPNGVHVAMMIGERMLGEKVA